MKRGEADDCLSRDRGSAWYLFHDGDIAVFG